MSHDAPPRSLVATLASTTFALAGTTFARGLAALPTSAGPASQRPPVAGIRTVRMLALAFLASILMAALGRLTKVEGVALIGGYGVVFLGVGAAPFQLRPGLDLPARLTGAVLVGFSVLLVLGALMADVGGLWHPLIAMLLCVGAAAALHWIGWARAGSELRAIARSTAARQARREARARARQAQPSRRPEAGRAAAPTLGGRPHETTRRAVGQIAGPLGLEAKTSLAVTTAGSLLWLVPAAVTRDQNPGFWGLLGTIGPFWYLGLVAVLIGFAIGRRHELAAAAAVVSFGVATTLTPALVYEAPRQQTAGKQLLLTQYVLNHHHIAVTGGIYQAFSSTFAGVAWLAELLGIHGTLGPMSLFAIATYWPVMLVFARIATLRCLAGRLLPTTARRWTAVLLVLLVDSLGADYFSPQSIGYVLAVGAVALVVSGPRPRPLGTRSTAVLLTLAGVALAVTHELSPYLAAGALVILSLLEQAEWWACLPVGLPALIWAGVVHKAISQNFNFGALFDLSNFRPPVTVASAGLRRLPIVGDQSHTLLAALLLLVALGALGFIPNIRTRWAWAYALCPIVGLGFIAINPYGNEGIFRATLFAIPWMAVLAMRMPHPALMAGRLTRPPRLGQPPRLALPPRPARPPRPTRPPRLAAPKWLPTVRLRNRSVAMTAGISACLVTLLGTFVVAAYAMDGTNVLPRDDVSVVDYLASRPAQDAFVLGIGSAGDPADGVSFAMDYTALEWSEVVGTSSEFEQRHPTRFDLTALTAEYGLKALAYGSTVSSPLYIMWTRSSLLYAQAYGLQSPSELEGWLHLLLTSRQWELVDHDGDAYLFRLRR